MARDEEILKRRARFISTALVLAAGCSREQSQATRVPEADGKPSVATAQPQPVGPVKPPADRPPLDAKVSTAGESKRAESIASIEKTHAAMSKLAGAVPAPCGLNHADCMAKFKTFADEWARLRDELLDFSPRCPAKLPDDIAIDGMLSAHRAWLTKWLDAIEAAGKSAALSQSDASNEWNKLRNDAIEAHPQPCLKFYCP